MPDANSWTEMLRPDYKAVLYSVAGFALNQVWSIFKGRRATVTWTAYFQTIRPGHEPTSSKVSILVNERESVNLQTCQISVINNSSKDIEDIDILFAFDVPFVIVEGRGGLQNSGKMCLFSAQFINTAKILNDTPEADRKALPSFDYVLRHREFHLPALNRGETANFTFWIESSQPGLGASVRASTEKAGVKLISLPADIRPMNVSLFKQTVIIGIITSLLFGYGLAQTELAPLPKTMFAVLGGMLSGIFGLSLVMLLRWLRRVV